MASSTSSSSSSSASTNQGEKLKHENFPTYQSHLSSFGPSSSTSSAPDYKYKYNVFISFRGEDTRNSFIGHLHRDLIRNGISVFKDDEELDRGKQISPGLLQAIEDSRFSMVVLSKNYATSSWCLDELVHILECSMKPGKSIIPIFYDVDPYVVRHQSGTYATAFAELENKYPADKVQKWRFALSSIANISGWLLNNGSEPEFIQKIVEDVSRKLTFEDEEFKYHVFLSFKIGEDSVVNFTQDLYAALASEGIIALMDNEESDKGKHISPELLEAIKGSRLIIIILSTNYAASSWCLDELVNILERTRTSVTRSVIPLFYNVKPHEVGRQADNHKKAVAEKEEKFSKQYLERVERWRSALAEVSRMSWDLNNENEVELIQKTVQDVSRKLMGIFGGEISNQF